MIPKPYNDLYIYYIEGRLIADKYQFGQNFIGNWEEDNFSFLFFSSPARNDVESLLRSQPQLNHLDTYHMSYDQWQNQTFETVSYGRFCIIPPWEASASQTPQGDDDIPILLDPSVVFGTGTHPTTRSCLEALELAIAESPPESVLDLGTGTGLLAVAAAKLGCRKICAVDINMLAALTARNNVIINGLENTVLVAKGKAENFIDCPADLVIANIHYDVMQRLIESSGFLQKQKFILSGLLRSEAKAMSQKLAQFPVKILKTWTQDGIWHTLYGKRKALLKKVGKPSKIR